jgi:hypothetical protein
MAGLGLKDRFSSSPVVSNHSENDNVTHLTSRCLDDPPEIGLEHVRREVGCVRPHKIFDGVDVRGKRLELSSKRRKNPVQKAYSASLAWSRSIIAETTFFLWALYGSVPLSG